ncbi:FG-GAP repeat protein [Micromonospora halophytica]|uniref:FG-GAP repeat-containing protein n=1 Tax=Micromonospora halophytica TaxID=47864 RepID=A0A1C5ICR9_9ACTN|nr:FG-GAP repeat protein [Micromonospora halophytica]SCG55975.1 FG-GAP repeat-containing protein [Micromonospora halophytica]
MSVSLVAVLAGLALGAPARAADDVQVITRDGVVLQHHRVAKATTPVRGNGGTRSDFDGDGVDDLAVSSEPMNYDLPHGATGLVVVRYSSAPQVDYLIGGQSPEGGSSGFGSAVVAGNFNGDRYDDLAIGNMDEVDPGNKAHAGGVWVIPGSSVGLLVGAAKHFNQSSAGVPGASENYDWFGASLAAGDINGDGREDLAIGAYGEAIGTKTAAGSVTVLYGGSTGLTTTGAQYLQQDQAGVPGAAERDDYFGYSLAIGNVDNNRYKDLVIGALRENDGVSYHGSGMVTLMWGSPTGVSSTGATSVTGAAVYGAAGGGDVIAWHLGATLAVGDANGDGLGEVVVGAPGAQTPHLNGGLVAVFTGRTAGLSGTEVRIFTQWTAGVPGTPENDDHFGASLATGDVTGDGRADVLVGSPGEEVGPTGQAGVITLLKGSAAGVTGSGAQAFDQNHADIPGTVERGDQFGKSVAVLNLDDTGPLDAVVASPGEEVAGDTPGYASGSMVTFHGSTGGLVPQFVSWSGGSLRTDRIWPMGYGKRVAGPQSGGGF